MPPVTRRDITEQQRRDMWDEYGYDIDKWAKMDKWLYFHVFDDDKLVVVACVKEKILSRQDLVDLDQFLAYYGQNYKVRGSEFEEGVSHTCSDIKCVRKHIIDANVRR